ncbi:hypothetical protein [Leptospira noguchii]|nr:hypothetical protein [Leptospira noguchii]
MSSFFTMKDLPGSQSSSLKRPENGDAWDTRPVALLTTILLPV